MGKHKRQLDTDVADDLGEQENFTIKKKKKKQKNTDDNITGIEVSNQKNVKSPSEKKKTRIPEENNDIGDVAVVEEWAKGNDGGTTTPKKNKKRRTNEEDKSDVASGEEECDINDEDDTGTRKKKKSKKNKMEKSADSTEEPQCSKPASALAYLRKWKNDKSNWKFQTVRQVWLLQHLYDSNLIPDGDFSMMLEYIDSIKGRSRILTLKKAQDMMQLHEDAEGENEPENSDSVKEKGKDQDTEKPSQEDEEEQDGSKPKPAKGELLSEDVYERVRQVIRLLL